MQTMRRARANDDCEKARCVQHTTAQDICCFCWYGVGAPSATDNAEVELRVPRETSPNPLLFSAFPPRLLDVCLLLLYARPPAVNSRSEPLRRLRAEAPARPVAHDFQMRMASEPM